MPRPPEHEDFFGLKFITNVMFAGCSIPYDVIIEFSEEPQHDLFMLIAGINAFDIVQGMFNPTKGRRRKPARHGRKRGRFRGIPDVNDEIGRRLVPVEIRQALNRIGPYRIAFRLFNAYEGLNFAAAVAELSTQALVSGIWGAFMLDLDTCQNLPRASRSRPEELIIGGVGPEFWPMNLYIQDFENEMNSTGLFMRCSVSDWGVGMRATVFNPQVDDEIEVTFRLSDGGSVTWAESSPVTIAPRATADVNVHANIPSGQSAYWVGRSRGGRAYLYDSNALGFGEAGWLDWAR